MNFDVALYIFSGPKCTNVAAVSVPLTFQQIFYSSLHFVPKIMKTF